MLADLTVSFGNRADFSTCVAFLCSDIHAKSLRENEQAQKLVQDSGPDYILKPLHVSQGHFVLVK